MGDIITWNEIDDDDDSDDDDNDQTYCPCTLVDVSGCVQERLQPSMRYSYIKVSCHIYDVCLLKWDLQSYC